MKVKMIGFVYARRSCEPGEEGHCEHDALLKSFWPAKVSTEDCCANDASEINKITTALNVESPPGLHLIDERSRSLNVFFEEHVLFEEVEHDQQRSNDEGPLREKAQSPLKRYPA